MLTYLKSVIPRPCPIYSQSSRPRELVRPHILRNSPADYEHIRTILPARHPSGSIGRQTISFPLVRPGGHMTWIGFYCRDHLCLNHVIADRAFPYPTTTLAVSSNGFCRMARLNRYG